MIFIDEELTAVRAVTEALAFNYGFSFIEFSYFRGIKWNHLTPLVYWLRVTLLWYVILACQVADPYRLIKSNKFIFEILQVKGRACCSDLFLKAPTVADANSSRYVPPPPPAA